VGFGLFPFSFAENIMIIDAHATDTVPSHEVRRRAQEALTNAGEPMSEVTYDALRKRIAEAEATIVELEAAKQTVIKEAYAKAAWLAREFAFTCQQYDLPNDPEIAAEYAAVVIESSIKSEAEKL
jgi:hypothetical protein